MKSRVLKALSGILIVTLFGALLLPGCNGGGGFSSLTGLAKIMPQDTETIFFIDSQKLKSDTDFGDIYENMKDSFEYEVTAGSGEEIIDFDDIHYLGLALVDYDTIAYVSGDFDFDSVRGALEEEGYEQDEYMDVEIWYGPDDAVAIHGDTLIIGYEDGVESAIEAISDSQTSVYSSNDAIRDAIGELSSGLFSMVTADAFFPGAEVMAMSFSKEDADSMEFSGCFVFEDNDYAEDSVESIEDDLESADFADVRASRSGNRVKFTAIMDAEDAGLFW
jgi:hypothetical protein